MTVIHLEECDVHNDLLGDQAALLRTFNEDGYLFFRDVLDLSAIATARSEYAKLLREYGLIDDDESFHWSGADPENLPPRKLYGSGLDQRLIEQSGITSIVESVFDEGVSWIPITEYRIIAPGKPTPHEPWLFAPHQDAFYNQGLEFVNCWIPLVPIDDEVGGLAVKPGYHRKGNLHNADAPPMFEIPKEALSDGFWVRPVTYQPGDFIMFNFQLPHGGFRNRADRYRCSIDVRFTPHSLPRPVCGTVTDVSSRHITVNDGSESETFLVDRDTYVRSYDGKIAAVDDIELLYPSGQSVMIGRRSTGSSVASVVRPPKG